MTSEALEVTPEVVRREALTIPQVAQAIAVIRTHDEYAAAGSLLLKIKTMRKRIGDVFGPIVEAAFKTHRTAVAQRKDAEAPLDVAEAHLKRLICAYNEEQDRIRREAQRQAEEAARKAEEDRMLAEASAAEAAGDKETAQAIIEAPVVAPVVVVESTTPKVAGVSFRENWMFQIEDESKIPREYLIPDLSKIRGVVKAMKGASNIPGVRVYADKVVSGRVV